MNRWVTAFVLTGTIFSVDVAEAARRARVVVRTPRARVTVRTVRPAPVVRVAPRVHLAPVVFAGVAVALPSRPAVWRGSEVLDRNEGWTEFTMDVDRRGDRVLLQIERGAAQIDQVEVVFDNGEAMVVEFSDRIERPGVYSVVDFKDGRKVDHIRAVAKAAANTTEITLHLVS
jgi:hypothetical protein